MEAQAGTFLLQDFTPYDRSLKWEIQNRYYQSRGSEAWLGGEVPYQITSNSVAARQNAELIYAAVEVMEREGSLRENDAVRVLEMGSGLGLFAINFIRAFHHIDVKRGKKYRLRLKYFFTDYSEKSLRDARKNPTLKSLYDEGVLDFYLLNATASQKMRELSTNKTVPVPPLVAVIANYLHCCLPAKIIRKRDGNLYEKHIRLSIRKTAATKHLTSVEEVLKQHSHITENLVEEVLWKKVGTEFFKKPLHRKVVEEGVGAYPVATVIYPYASFASLENTISLLLPGGVIIISDKGYSDASQMKGERSCEPSIHGNSFAHALNFPLLENLSRRLGCSTSRTSDDSYSIQTIIIEHRRVGTLDKLFEKLFIRKNNNLTANDFYRAGYRFEEQREHLVAIRFCERARNLSSRDAYLYYCLGCAYFEHGNIERAIKMLRQGHEFDYFNKYDFDFEIGYILHLQSSYSEAVPFYLKSLKQKRTDIKLYNIGLCYENLKKPKKATAFFREALVLNPKYEKAEKELNRVQGKINS